MTNLIKTEYTIILPSHGRWEDCETHFVMWPQEPGYDKIAATINPIVGGYLEHVSVLTTDFPTNNVEPADMFVNDEGSMPGRHLPINPLATFLYHTFTRLKRGKHEWADCQPIYGPAVLFKRRVWF